MSGLSMLMAKAQGQLSRAQRHHAKLVDKMKKEAEKNFNDEAEKIGQGIGSFAKELRVSESVLEGALAAAEAGLKIEEKVPSKPDDWQDPGVAQRARLTAEINAVNRTLKHLQRTHDRDVHEQEDTANQAFEDGSMALSMKLGDLSEASESAKKIVVAAVEKLKNSNASDKVDQFNATAKDQQARIDAYKAHLKDAQKQSLDVAKVAQTKVGSFLAKAVKDVENDTARILEELATGQKKEIDKAFHRTPAPVAKASSVNVTAKAAKTTTKAAKLATVPKVSAKKTATAQPKSAVAIGKAVKKL